MSYSQPQGAPASAPGKGLGIAGLILAIFLPLIGLILSIVAKVQSNKAGVKNGPATAGIIIGAILTILGIVIAIIVATTAGALIGDIAAKCAELGPGTHTEGGITYTCS